MLNIDMKDKLVLIAGIADDQGFGWAIAKACKRAGARIIVATWPPALKIFKMSLERGKLDTDIGGGEKLEFEKVYPLDAEFDQLSDAPEEVLSNRRYAELGDFSITGLKNAIETDFGVGQIVACIHSLANGPEVKNPLLETSRKGYLAANSASSYSFVSMVQAFSPLMSRGGSFLALTYLASEQVVPGYGGGMSSAKAALESDVRTLSYEVGQKFGQRVNCISAGPLASRAAKSIGFIEQMVDFAKTNAPLPEELTADEVGNTAAFLCSNMASGITGATIYVDKGMHRMGFVPLEY